MFLRLTLVLTLVLGSVATSLSGFAAEPSAPQYLLFQIFLGGPESRSGIYLKNRSKDDILRMARQIATAARPARGDPNRILGFAVGPIAMDQGEDDARSVIRDAFDVALATDMAVALHLDDYMFWKQARLPDGRLLSSIPNSAEWRNWSTAPAGPPAIGWLPD